jgi:hypothetical protein
VLIGDRGMITAARSQMIRLGLDYCLRAPQIQALAHDHRPLQLSLFDEWDLAEISSPDFPGERLIVCRNRDPAAERARKREALLVGVLAPRERNGPRRLSRQTPQRQSTPRRRPSATPMVTASIASPASSTISAP